MDGNVPQLETEGTVPLEITLPPLVTPKINVPTEDEALTKKSFGPVAAAELIETKLTPVVEDDAVNVNADDAFTRASVLPLIP